MRTWLAARPWWGAGAWSGSVFGIIGVFVFARDGGPVEGLVGGLVVAAVVTPLHALYLRWERTLEPPEVRAMDRRRRRLVDRASVGRRVPEDEALRADAVSFVRFRRDVVRGRRWVHAGATGAVAVLLLVLAVTYDSWGLGVIAGLLGVGAVLILGFHRSYERRLAKLERAG